MYYFFKAPEGFSERPNGRPKPAMTQPDAYSDVKVYVLENAFENAIFTIDAKQLKQHI